MLHPRLRRLVRSTAFSAALLLALLFASPARAQHAAPTPAQKETARNLMQTGDKQFKAKDYAAALASYRAADDIMGVPTTSVAVGRAYAQLGQLVEAVDALNKAINYPKEPKESPLFGKAREEAAKLDAELAPRIPAVTVAVTGPRPDEPVSVAIDGVAVDAAARGLPHRVNPGKHAIVASAPGFRDGATEVTLAEGEQKTATVALERLPPPPPVKPPPPKVAVKPPPRRSPPPPRPMGLRVAGGASLGIGAAALLAGAITGGLSLAKQHDLLATCPGNVCPDTDDAHSAHDRVIALANASNATLAIGGALVLTGVTLLAVDAARKTEPSVLPTVGLGMMGLVGRF